MKSAEQIIAETAKALIADFVATPLPVREDPTGWLISDLAAIVAERHIRDATATLTARVKALEAVVLERLESCQNHDHEGVQYEWATRARALLTQGEKG